MFLDGKRDQHDIPAAVVVCMYVSLLHYDMFLHWSTAWTPIFVSILGPCALVACLSRNPPFPPTRPQLCGVPYFHLILASPDPFQMLHVCPMHINTGPSDVTYSWVIFVAVIPFIAHVILAISIVLFLCLYVHNRAFNVQ